MNTSLKKPPAKVVDGLTDILEEMLKKPKVKVESTPHLTSIVFTECKVPNKIGELREEFHNRGYLFFYSEVVEKEKVFTFFNITKVL